MSLLKSEEKNQLKILTLYFKYLSDNVIELRLLISVEGIKYIDESAKKINNKSTEVFLKVL